MFAMWLKLIQRKIEAPGVESFTFKPYYEGESVSFKPGQYFHYVLHHVPTDDRGSDRWFTCSSAPFEGVATITTRHDPQKSSSFKQKLFELKVGDSLEITGAAEGSFTVESPSGAHVFIAGGIGITPFHSILKQADHDGIKLDATLIYGNRDSAIVFKDELDAFASRNPNLKVHYLVAPQVIDEATIRQLVPDLAAPVFYVSGPEPMVKSIIGVLEGMGIAKERIKQDDFPGYGVI